MSGNDTLRVDAQSRPQPTRFRKVLNPEARAINGLLGSTGDDKVKSYLNPLCPYSKNPNVGFIERFSEPFFTTVDQNVGKRHFGYLNPIHAIASNDTTKNKIRSAADPAMAMATSFIENETVRDTAYALLNPIGGLITKLFG